MTDRAIFSIEIDDSAFDEFQKKFAAYQEALAGHAGKWAEAGDEIAKHTSQFEKLHKGIRDQVEATNSKSLSKYAGELGALDVAWGSIAGLSKFFHEHITKATLSLVKWGTLTTVFSGLVGAGGLYGINRMAAGIANRRSEALALGVGYGERQSININLGRLGNTEGLLQGYNRALNDVRESAPLSGLFPQGVPSRNAAETIVESLPEIKRIVTNVDPRLLRNVTGPSGRNLGALGWTPEMLQVIQKMSPEELQDIMRRARADIKDLDIDKASAKKWSDFDSQMERAGNKIENVLRDNLVHLTRPLTHLSKAVTHLAESLLKPGGPAATELKSLNKQITRFARWLKSPNVGSNVNSYTKDVDIITHAIEQLYNKYSGGFSAMLGIAVAARYGSGAAVAIGGALAGVPLGGAAIAAGAAGGAKAFLEDPGYALGGSGWEAAKRLFGYGDSDKQKSEQPQPGAQQSATPTPPSRPDVSAAPSSVTPTTPPSKETAPVGAQVTPTPPARPSIPSVLSPDPIIVPKGGASASSPMAGGEERFDVVGNAKEQGIQNVDPRLVNILRSASKDLPKGYKAELFSGYRPGDKRYHGQGIASDIRILDPQGKELHNYQDPRTFRTYEKFAQSAKKYQTEQYPELSHDFRWGGYFAGEPGKYGAVDEMHFDFGRHGVMGGGSFEHGLTPEQKRLYPGAESKGMGDIDSWHHPESIPMPKDEAPTPSPSSLQDRTIKNYMGPNTGHPQLQGQSSNVHVEDNTGGAVSVGSHASHSGPMPNPTGHPASPSHEREPAFTNIRGKASDIRIGKHPEGDFDKFIKEDHGKRAAKDAARIAPARMGLLRNEQHSRYQEMGKDAFLKDISHSYSVWKQARAANTKAHMEQEAKTRRANSDPVLGDDWLDTTKEDNDVKRQIKRGDKGIIPQHDIGKHVHGEQDPAFSPKHKFLGEGKHSGSVPERRLPSWHDQPRMRNIKGRASDIQNTPKENRPTRNLNPGNIRFGKFAQEHGAIGKDKDDFAIFPNAKSGDQAQRDLLFNTDKYSQKTIPEMARVYAPPKENNTERYTKNLMKGVDAKPGTKLSDFTPKQRDALIANQQRLEGYKGPKVMQAKNTRAIFGHPHQERKSDTALNI